MEGSDMFENYDGTITKATAGARESAETIALKAAISESAATKTPKVWSGTRTLDVKEFAKRRTQVRLAAKKVGLGVELGLSVDGDLVFTGILPALTKDDADVTAVEEVAPKRKPKSA